MRRQEGWIFLLRTRRDEGHNLINSGNFVADSIYGASSAVGQTWRVLMIMGVLRWFRFFPH